MKRRLRPWYGLFPILSAALVPLLVIGCDPSQPDSGNVNSDEFSKIDISRIPVVPTIPDKRLEQYGSWIPDTLSIEAAQGIKSSCFLRKNVMQELPRAGLNMIKCDEKYAVAVGKDNIGIGNNITVKREPLNLIILQTERNLERVQRMRGILTKTVSEHYAEKIRERFRVSEERKGITVSGIVYPSGAPFGTAFIFDGPSNLCEFSFSDNPFPQTVCYKRMGDIILVLKTNSTSYEPIRRTLDRIAMIHFEYRH